MICPVRRSLLTNPHSRKLLRSSHILFVRLLPQNTTKLHEVKCIVIAFKSRIIVVHWCFLQIWKLGGHCIGGSQDIQIWGLCSQFGHCSQFGLIPIRTRFPIRTVPNPDTVPNSDSVPNLDASDTLFVYQKALLSGHMMPCDPSIWCFSKNGDIKSDKIAKNMKIKIWID